MNNKNEIRLNQAIMRFTVAAVVLALGSACMKARQFTATDPGINDYPEANRDSTNRYLNGLGQWTHYPVLLSCEGCTKRFHFRISLHENTKKIDASDALDAGRGHIVARIENQENDSFPPFRLGKGRVVFLWVGQTGKSVGRAFAIYHIDPYDVHGIALAYQGSYCTTSYPGDDVPVHEAAPNYCGNNPHVIYKYSGPPTSMAAGQVLKLISNAVRPEPTAMLNAGGDLWFSCSSGCCQASSWGFY